MRGKKVLVGLTGGIAAYKVAYLIRELIKMGADVRVMMTEAATKFVTPLTFSALCKKSAYTDLWSANQALDEDISMQHINLANWADVVLIAPASANTIAKLANGISDNILTVVALATSRPIILAPTMDADMYLNPSTQKNLNLLRERGYFVIPPAEGELASGLSGKGRLPEIKIIADTIKNVLDKSYQDLSKKNIIVTAGPTYEAIDPIRFIGNRSSGKMGYAIANVAAQRGAKVTLISGPTSLETPRGVERIDVESAEEMFNAIVKHYSKTNAVIMAAAVADFKPVKIEKNKIKKSTKENSYSIQIEPTKDILFELGKKKKNKILVGFALETENATSNAKEKLKKKNLDFIVLNKFSENNKVFGSDMNVVTFLDKNGKVEKLPFMSKYDISTKILDKVKLYI